MTASILSWQSALSQTNQRDLDLARGNSSREKEIQIARTVIFPTGKSGGVESTGHDSPMQWQAMILVSHFYLLRCFPIRDDTQQPAIGKTLVLILSVQHNMEEKDNFKQPGSWKSHAFPRGKSIICELSPHPNLTVNEKEMTWQNNICYTTDHVNQILSSVCLNHWLTNIGHHKIRLVGEE